jgi:hypothetical protein
MRNFPFVLLHSAGVSNAEFFRIFETFGSDLSIVPTTSDFVRAGIPSVRAAEIAGSVTKFDARKIEAALAVRNVRVVAF